MVCLIKLNCKQPKRFCGRCPVTFAFALFRAVNEKIFKGGRQMNKYPYPAVLLMGYQRLGGLIERLEWTVYNRALATHGFSGAFPLSTLEQVSEIIKLIDRKTLLSELKKTVVRCLNRMEKQERVILVRHFVRQGCGVARTRQKRLLLPPQRSRRAFGSRACGGGVRRKVVFRYLRRKSVVPQAVQAACRLGLGGKEKSGLKTALKKKIFTDSRRNNAAAPFSLLVRARADLPQPFRFCTARKPRFWALNGWE